MNRSFVKIFAIALLVLLCTALASAQLTSGDLVGVVRDGSGAVLSSVNVQVTNLATGFSQSQQTSSVGEYHFTNLPVGHYKVEVNTKSLVGGFSDVEVQLNKSATANVIAQVAGAGTTVEVTGETATIDTTTAQIQNTYELKETQDLPSASQGLGVLNLSLLDAGVASSGGIGVGTGPSISGQRPRNNNFTVEGVDNNSKSVTGPVVTIPNDAVQNFTVLQNQFSPEFGHSSGGQFNQTIISGTNQFHGRLYEYFQNRDLNAIDASTARTEFPGPYTNPRYDNNRFGGQIGGPIVKDKLFFFSSNEYNPVGNVTGGYYVCAPTALGYSQIAGLGGSGISQTNLQIFQKYIGTAAQAGGPGCPGDTSEGASPNNNLFVSFDPNSGYNATGQYEQGQINTNGSYFSNTFTTTNSIDFNISDKDQLRGRWIYQHFTSLDNAANLPTFWTPLPVRDQLVAVSEYHTFTPGLTNEMRLGFNRNTQYFTVGNQTFPGLDQFPNLQFYDVGFAQLGPDPNAPQFGVQNIYQLTDNVSWIKGRNTFKFGAEGRKYISPQGFTQRARGDYEYSYLSEYFLDNVPDAFGERSTGNTTYYGDQSAIYVYGNDQIKVNSHLSLNLGLRYEFTSVPYSERLQSLNSAASVPGLISFNKPAPQYTNFAPRVGFAYSPGTSGNTSIRGGYGIAYDVLFDNLGLLSVPPQFGSTCDVSNGSTSVCPYNSSTFLAGGGYPAGNGSGLTTFSDVPTQQASTSGFVPNQVIPYTETWNLGVQHVFANKYTLDVRYVGTRGVHLPVQDQLNKQPQVTSTNYIPTFITPPSAAQIAAITPFVPSASGSYVPNYVAGCLGAAFDSPCFASNITAYEPYGGSIYHGLQTQLSRNLTNGLQFQVAWTWSHAWDNSTAEVFSTQLTPRRPQDSQNVAADWGTSALDRRHRVTVELLYNYTAFKNSGWFMKNVVGNWEVAPVYTFQSPEYYTAQSGTDSNLNGDSAPDRAILNPLGVPGTGSAVTLVTDPTTGNQYYLADNPNAQYIQAGKGALSTVARNSVALPHINNFDLTAVKRFNITERQSIEFQAQALNVFNHSQFVAGAISSVQPVGFTSIGTFVDVNQANFNQPQLTFSNNPRTMQLVLKYNF